MRFLTLSILALASIPVGAILADEAARARVYMDWLDHALVRLDRDMVAITGSADKAIGPLLADKGLVVRDNRKLANELIHRTGGFIFVGETAMIQPRDGDVVLYALWVGTQRQPDLPALIIKQLDKNQLLGDRGCVVIAIAYKTHLKSFRKLTRAQEVCTVVIDNHAPWPTRELGTNAAGIAIPTFTTVNAAMAWT